MTQLEILNLAYMKQIDKVEREREHYKRLPKNELAKARYEQQQAKLQELHDLLIIEERKVRA